MILCKKRITKSLIRLRGCAGWSASVLFVNPWRQVLSRHGQIVSNINPYPANILAKICRLFITSAAYLEYFFMEANTINPDQTVPGEIGAVWSCTILFAIQANKMHARMREQTTNVVKGGKRVSIHLNNISKYTITTAYNKGKTEKIMIRLCLNIKIYIDGLERINTKNCNVIWKPIINSAINYSSASCWNVVDDVVCKQFRHDQSAPCGDIWSWST